MIIKPLPLMMNHQQLLSTDSLLQPEVDELRDKLTTMDTNTTHMRLLN